MIDLIPVGFKYQTKTEHIAIYGYLGAGAAILLLKRNNFENYEFTHNDSVITFIPTLNLGIGAKIKVKSEFILTEITPTMNGLFFSIGYSFK